MGTCQFQESVMLPTFVFGSYPACMGRDCRAILFHVFYEKPIITICQSSRMMERGV